MPEEKLEKFYLGLHQYALLDAANNPVYPVNAHVIEADRVWNPAPCLIDPAPFSGNPFRVDELGYDVDGRSRVKLGEKFVDRLDNFSLLQRYKNVSATGWALGLNVFYGKLVVDAGGGAGAGVTQNFGVNVAVVEPGIEGNEIRTVAHEMGHMLGLRHDFNDPNRLMFPNAQGGVLTQDECTNARDVGERQQYFS